MLKVQLKGGDWKKKIMWAPPPSPPLQTRTQIENEKGQRPTERLLSSSTSLSLE